MIKAPLQPANLGDNPVMAEKLAVDEPKFNFMELTEAQMYTHLQEVQTANEKSIARHLQVKAQANRLKDMLTETFI